MHRINIKQDPQVKAKFDSYPKHIKMKMNSLRDLIIETASEIDDIREMEETLKWGEPSYLVKKGSTIRMDWKPKSPRQYAMYFNCNTNLIDTFKMIYGDLFIYEKNRAIIFDINGEIPQNQLKECIKLALQYHLLKDKPFLGKW